MARAASLPIPLTGAGAGNVIYLGAARCRRKFELFYPDGFEDETYLVAERSYKERAHLEWETELGPADFRKLLARGEFRAIADAAVRIESRSNLLFSFETHGFARRGEDARGRPPVRHRALRLPLWPRLVAAQASTTGSRRWRDLPAAQEPGADLAGGHGVRLHCPARQAPVPQAARDPQGGPRLRLSTCSTSATPSWPLYQDAADLRGGACAATWTASPASRRAT